MSIAETASSTPVTSFNECSCGERRMNQFYCENDNEIFCKPCKHDFHLNCNVQKLLHTAQGVLDSENLKQTTSDLETLKSVFLKMKENKHLASLQQRQERKNMFQISKQLMGHHQTGRYFDHDPEDHINSETDLPSKFDKCKYILERITEYLHKLKEFDIEQDEIGAFIVLHRAKEDLPEIRSFLNHLNESKLTGLQYPNFPAAVLNKYNAENQGNVKMSRRMHVTLPTIRPPSRTNMSKRFDKIIQPEGSKSRSNEGSAKDKPRGPRLLSARWRSRPGFKPPTIRMATVLSSIRTGVTSRAFSKSSSVMGKLVSPTVPEEIYINKKGADIATENHVTSMLYLKDRRFAALDCRGNRMKLFSVDHRYLSEMAMHSSVWDFTAINKTVLITCPAEGKIQKVQVTSNNRLFEAGVILTQKDCRAICFHNNRIYVTYTGLCPCIKILSKDGIMYRSIDAIQKQTKIFQNPLYMYISKKCNLIYVSDFTLQRLILIDHKGNVRGTRDVSPNWPLGLSADKDDNVIVAVTGVNDVKLVANGGLAIKTLVDSRKLDGDPCSVMCRQGIDGQTLYVAFSGMSTVKVFKLLY